MLRTKEINMKKKPYSCWEYPIINGNSSVAGPGKQRGRGYDDLDKAKADAARFVEGGLAAARNVIEVRGPEKSSWFVRGTSTIKHSNMSVTFKVSGIRQITPPQVASYAPYRPGPGQQEGADG